MILHWEGREAPTPVGINRQATDQQGVKVVVSATVECINDHGWREIWQFAEERYYSGKFETIGGIPTVKVTSADL